MLNTKKILQDFAPRQSLYCVWIRANEATNAPLVSVWIDSDMRAFEANLTETLRGSSRSLAGALELDAWTAKEDDYHPREEIGHSGQSRPRTLIQVPLEL